MHTVYIKKLVFMRVCGILQGRLFSCCERIPCHCSMICRLHEWFGQMVASESLTHAAICGEVRAGKPSRIDRKIDAGNGRSVIR